MECEWELVSADSGQSYVMTFCKHDNKISRPHDKVQILTHPHVNLSVATFRSLKH